MRTPAEQLTMALLAMASTGRRPRCSDPDTHDYWTSDSPAERETAAAWCAGCPILQECDAAAEGEKFGVWGGRDRAPTKPGS